MGTRKLNKLLMWAWRTEDLIRKMCWNCWVESKFSWWNTAEVVYSQHPAQMFPHAIHREYPEADMLGEA